jgi:hypothetical protein
MEWTENKEFFGLFSVTEELRCLGVNYMYVFGLVFLVTGKCY